MRFILHLFNFFKIIRGNVFVYVASETRNAHKEWISYFKSLGHAEVDLQGDADYLLVFCPVKSRIKTDIDEALENIPDGKVILVVMHHTFDPDLLIGESRQHVTRPNVRLTVDCLFYEGELLNCNINRVTKNQIQKCLGVSTSYVWYIWFLQWVFAAVVLLKKIVTTSVSLVQSLVVRCLNCLCWGLRPFMEWVCHILGIR